MSLPLKQASHDRHLMILGGALFCLGIVAEFLVHDSSGGECFFTVQNPFCVFVRSARMLAGAFAVWGFHLRRDRKDLWFTITLWWSMWLAIAFHSYYLIAAQFVFGGAHPTSVLAADGLLALVVFASFAWLVARTQEEVSIPKD